MSAKSPKSSSDLVNNIPREILYQILSLCDETYDVVERSHNYAEQQCLSVGQGCGSRNLSRVCHLWKSCVEAGMVPSTPLSEIQLTDEQFLQINYDFNQERTSPLESSVTSESEPAILRGYHTITIIYDNHHQNVQSDISKSSPPHTIGKNLRIPAPKILNLVIVDERVTDIRQVLDCFKTSYKSIRDDLHDEYLASHEILEEYSDINIIVWNGGLCNIPPPNFSKLSPGDLTLRIHPGFGRVDLYINRWIDPGSVGDIPWVFGQLYRGARPHTLGFHLMSPHGLAITDQWHVQKHYTGPGNTLLRHLYVSGIGSDGFLRLLQCSAIQVWSVRVLEIALPKHLANECFWDWRIFEKDTWPVYKEGPMNHERSLPVNDHQGMMEFPQLALGRLVDGRIKAVEKEKMESHCQIAYFGPDLAVEWDMRDRAQNDIESYAGRSLRWASLELVVAGGGLVCDFRRQ